MDSKTIVKGEMRQGDVPDWEPLQQTFLSDGVCGWFMWMYDIELEDGRLVNAYKHCSSRRYLHMGQDLRTYDYTGEQGYVEIDPYHAIARVFAGRTAGELTDEERHAVREAMLRAAARYEEQHPELFGEPDESA